MGKHYINYLVKVLELCYFTFLLRKKMLIHELFSLIQRFLTFFYLSTPFGHA